MKFNNTKLNSNSKGKTTSQGYGKNSRPKKRGKKMLVGQGRR